ncbi:Nucleoside-diphosphate-sugar epimerase [Desulfuromusa kysingii]|uniref:Nucleoside-diphosphate-sugar epimerase n=1 Tax=Desulfuromusa kysingii TaxID=37625 RepID=A0A1H4EAD3_9BACT|nr:NAD-dependent epimerase/dehydratase family protein [Desulfuromusa kysingii]SEA81991.1 Nucleoside-diphosphate-sugar epimerase [Desulfuromusa kysingii]
MSKYTVIGCGDIGFRVSKELLQQGHQVQATIHYEEGTKVPQSVGIETIIANFDYREDVPDLPLHGHKLFYFMPPQGGGSSDYRMLNFCQQLTPDNSPSKIVYMSTSGVYGDCGDTLVTEETPVNPQTSRAKRRVSAEQQLQEQAEKLGFELVILRVTGIYGPGRLPLSQLKKGHEVLRPEDAPRTNRIHSLDLVQICLAAMERGKGGDIFNVCDGEESSMSHYFMAVAEMYQLPQPKQLSWSEAEKGMNPLTFSFLKESRRMSNRKLIETLGVELKYPTLEKGLFACRTIS